jgi:hypothetical protein
MNIVEYQITTGRPENIYWCLLPYPILTAVGQFLILDQKYEDDFDERYAGISTKIGTGTKTSLSHSWYEVNAAQYLP